MNSNHKYEKIRDRAEQLLSTIPEQERVKFSNDVDSLLHELEVYHVELEMQNDELRRMQDHLGKTLSMYTDLFNRGPVSRLIVNQNGIVLHSNEHFCTVSCFTMDQVQNKPLINFIHEEDHKVFYSLFSAFHKSPEGKTLKLRINCHEQQIKEVEITGQEISDLVFLSKEYGHGPFLLLTLIDVTELNQNLRMLERSERKYRMLADNMTDVIWIYNLSKNSFVYVSPSVTSLRGYSVDEVLQQGLEQVIDPDEIALFKAKIANHLLKFINNPAHNEPVVMELQQQTRSGQLVWTETSLRFIINDEGEVEVVGVSRDIEVRKKLELELIRSSMVIEQSSMGMMVTDHKGYIQYVNPMVEKITGYTFEDMIGQEASRFRSEYAPGENEIGKELQVRRSWQGIFLNRRKDGTEYWESMRVDSIVNQAGRVTHFVSVKEDVTKKIEQENELRAMNLRLEAANAKAHEMAIKAQEANIAKSKFLSNMSHEIRTPLNAVIGFSQLIDRQSEVSTVVKDFNNRILRSGEHLLSLVNDVLELSRIESGRYELQESDIRLDDMMHDLLSVYSVPARQKHIELVYTPGEELPELIMADENKLRRVLINLISNAIKFTNKGKVEVAIEMRTTHKGASFIYFRVKDTGVGIDTDDIRKLFVRFEQVGEGTLQSSGSGLGLSLVYEMVKLMGGDVKVQSKLGEGSEFSFYIPFRAGILVNGRGMLHRHIRRIHPLVHRKFHILIADDTEENLILSAEMLRSVGYEVTTAVDGADLIGKYDISTPDLVLMDLHMPVMDGMDALRSIRSRVKGSRIPVVAMTASSFADDRERVLKAGFTGFVLKPFRIDGVLELIGELLNVEYELEESNDVFLPETNPVDLSELRQQLQQVESRTYVKMLNLIKKADLDEFNKLIDGLPSRQLALKLYLKELVADYNYTEIAKLLEGRGTT